MIIGVIIVIISIIAFIRGSSMDRLAILLFTLFVLVLVIGMVNKEFGSSLINMIRNVKF